jgi:hypothetical protein
MTQQNIAKGIQLANHMRPACRQLNNPVLGQRENGTEIL